MRKTNLKILVTGSTGFVGQHLCHELYQKGHEVYALARSEKKFQDLKVPGSLIVGDLSNTKKWVTKLPEDLDIVIHTAGLVSTFDISDFYIINHQYTKNLVLELKQHYQELQFIHLSSVSALGPSNEAPLDESIIPLPVSEYGKSKLLSEKAVIELAPEKWNKVIIRPPIVIGPKDTAFIQVFKIVNSGISITSGESKFDKKYSFICVFDLVKGIIQCLDNPYLAKVETFNMSHDQIITFSELVDNISKAIGKNPTFKITIPVPILKLTAKGIASLGKLPYLKISPQLTPDKVHEIIQSAWVCDNSYSKKKLNMIYDWPLSKTLEATAKDFLL